MKQFLFILFLLFSGSFLFAQDVERVIIFGSIEVPPDEEVAGIYIYNMSTHADTRTNELGDFYMKVAENDSLQISPEGFQDFIVVIDKGVIRTEELNIYVDEVVNQLPEVVVTPYDISGNVAVDISRLSVADLPVDLTAADVMWLDSKVGRGPDLPSRTRNDALAMSDTRLEMGFQFADLFRELLLTNKRKKIDRPNADIDTDVRKLYEDEFFQEYLDIKLENINDFIFFADDNGLTEEMLKEGNELELIEFLVEQSKKYKKQR